MELLPLVLDVDGSVLGEPRGHARARHGGERRGAEHEVGAVGPGAVRDDHPGARRRAELRVLAPNLQTSGEVSPGETLREGSRLSDRNRIERIVTWKQAPQPTPSRYSAGLAAARKTPSKVAAALP